MVMQATQRYGIGLTPDSVTYVSVARHVVAGRGITDYQDRPLVLQPPLYPLVLAAAARLTHLDPMEIARLLNAVLLAAILATTGLILLRLLRIPYLLATVGLIFTLTGGPVLGVSLRAWSEPLFIFLLLLHLTAAVAYARHPDRSRLAGMALSAAATSLTRYIGVAVLPAGAVVILRGRRPLRARLIHLGVYAGSALLPLTIWLLRNFLVSGSLLGQRGPSVETLGSNVQRLLWGIALWFRPPHLLRAVAWSPLLFGVAAVLAAGLLWRALRDSRDRDDRAGEAVWMTAGSYLVFLLITSTTTAYDPINFRLLSPAFVPLLLGLLIVLHRALPEASWRLTRPPFTGWVVIAAMLLMLARPIFGTAQVVRKAARQGIGYHSRAWRSDQLATYLKKQRSSLAGLPLYSNSPEALYVLCNLRAGLSPCHRMHHSSRIVARPEDLAGRWPPQGRAYLVWFLRERRPYLFPPADLCRIARLVALFRCRDGTLYAVRPTKGSGPVPPSRKYH